MLRLQALDSTHAGVLAVLEQECFGLDAWSQTILEAELASPYRRYAAVFDGENIVSYGGIGIPLLEGLDSTSLLPEDFVCELLTLATVPTARGLGHARFLLSHLATLAQQAQGRVLMLEVRQANGAARRLYESAGFQVVGRRRNYYRNPLDDALVMSAALPLS